MSLIPGMAWPDLECDRCDRRIQWHLLAGGSFGRYISLVGSFEVLLRSIQFGGRATGKTNSKYDMWAWQHDWKNTQARSRITYFSDENIGGSEKVPPSPG